MEEILNAANPVIWTITNFLIAYVVVMLIAFVGMYAFFFNPKSTMAGKFIFRLAFSLIGVIGIAFTSVFIDPHGGTEWFKFPGDVAEWRPLFRMFGYGYTAYAVTGLVWLLAVRRWKTEPDAIGDPNYLVGKRDV